MKKPYKTYDKYRPMIKAWWIKFERKLVEDAKEALKEEYSEKLQEVDNK